jgi:hypothetical protein
LRPHAEEPAWLPFRRCLRTPSRCSPERRARAVAALLATGLVRLGSSLLPSTSPAPDAHENLAESDPNRLAEGLEKSLAVSAG